MEILLVDNYDSFTYNLLHLLEKNTQIPIKVVRNDEIFLVDIDKYDRIVISPGPGMPQDAGRIIELIQNSIPHANILGVCLGMQAIAVALGGELKNLEHVYHGVSHPIHQKMDSLIFKDLPKSFQVGRYHSWVIDKDSLPSSLEISSEDDYGNIMSVQHKTLKIFGLQFHPESVLTEHGDKIINNWLNT